MSATDQSAPAPSLPNRQPFTIRLSPEVVNGVCAWPKNRKPARTQAVIINGLLFGNFEEDLINVQAFSPFLRLDPVADPILERKRLDEIFELSVAMSRVDPKLSSLQLIGWYSIHAPDTEGLLEAELDFHNRHFSQPTGVALVVKPAQKQHVDLELYTRLSAAPLSSGNYRLASAQIPKDEPLDEPLDLVMRAPLGDDFYFRAYQVGKSLDRAERREEWKRMVLDTKQAALSFLAPLTPKPKRVDEATTPLAKRLGLPLRLGAAGKPARKQLAASEGNNELGPRLQRTAGEPLALTRFAPPKRPGIPWLSSALIFLLAAGATVAFFYVRGVGPGTGIAFQRFLRTISPNAGLMLRVDEQGDRLLVSWNRRSAMVRSATGGILRIEDGARDRTVHLDSLQIADGSVLYKPASDDVTFRLEVLGNHGAITRESMRVLDGTKSADATPPTASPQPEPIHSPETKSAAQPPATAALDEKLNPVYVPPRPSNQVLPKVFGRRIVSRPTRVQVRVNIDEAGRVTSAHVLNGRKITGALAASAVIAAKQWTFEPAKLGGKPIPGEHTIVFEFRPQRH